MAAPGDGCTLVAVRIVHPVCARNRSTGHCIVDRCLCVGVRNLFDGLGISTARASALNGTADLVLGVAGMWRKEADDHHSLICFHACTSSRISHGSAHQTTVR